MLDDFLSTTLCTSGVLRRSVLRFIRFTWEDRARSGSITVCPSSATLASRKVKTIGRPRVPGHVVSLSLLTTGPVPPLGRAHPFPFVFPAGFPPHWTEHLPEKGLQCANAFVLSLFFFSRWIFLALAISLHLSFERQTLLSRVEWFFC